MQKITFTNSINNLSAEFSTDTPLMFLEAFDGNSCGAGAVTYKPLEFDGQRLISSSLTARTITATVNFGGISDGQYSRSTALAIWDTIQRVFVPGNVGTLVWTNGTISRQIKCRTAETPNFSQILPYLFRVSFELVADSPLWYDTVEQSTTFTSSQIVTINNPCGIAVPFEFEVTGSGAQPWLISGTADASLALFQSIAGSQTCVINTDDCTVKLYTSATEFTYANHLLSVVSEFFKLLPGNNELACFSWSSGQTAVLKWHKAYMGVG